MELFDQLSFQHSLEEPMVPVSLQELTDHEQT